ncbi:MAG: hypothetical protein MZV70_29620 [Desulfobacterales bacterium]|nr:hypothetical protein [Desulfobacterales bacterium]
MHHYAPQFFTHQRQTPWGAAINFDGPGSRTVRDYFIHNALFWHRGIPLRRPAPRRRPRHPRRFGARLPRASSRPRVHDGPGRRRPIHLVLENDHNAARYLGGRDRPAAFSAQWNDDLHHALHVLLTGERHGYYADYAHDPLRQVGRCLTEGFAYQGEPSAFRRGRRRGEASGHLPPTAFVAFLQNHDQIGNRAGGERLITLCEAAALRAVSHHRAAGAVAAAALHGRGVRGGIAISILLRFLRAAAAGGARRPTAGVRPGPAFDPADGDARPRRPGDLRCSQARLGLRGIPTRSRMARPLPRPVGTAAARNRAAAGRHAR